MRTGDLATMETEGYVNIVGRPKDMVGAVFGQSIPRMPHDMAREGMPVARSALKRGDPVFFGYRGTFTHVGIYVGNDQFVHATHRGSPLQVSPLDGDYYRDRYMTAVRLSPR